ncbi:MAG: transcriptional repressor LexA, partial [Sphingopyxis sp.]
MLTRKQHELICFIDDRLAETGISPSFEEMKEALGLKSKSGIHRLISALEERGYLRRLPNRARALEITRQPERGPERGDARGALAAPSAPPAPGNILSFPPRTAPRPAFIANDIVELPLHGRIAAGVPIEAFEDSSQLAVPAALLGPGDHYALEVSGDSMVEAGILDGDYALIARANTAREGDIVVALVDGQDATLKYFRRDGHQIRLDPANPAYQAQLYDAGRVIVQGRL